MQLVFDQRFHLSQDPRISINLVLPNVLEMGWEELQLYISQHRGTGKQNSMYNIKKTVDKKPLADLWIEKNQVREASEMFIFQSRFDDDGSKRDTFGGYAWIIEARRELLKKIGELILKIHAEFFIFKGHRPLNAISQTEATALIKTITVKNRAVKVHLSWVSRCIKGKYLLWEGIKYPLAMFFTARLYHLSEIDGWLKEKIAIEDATHPLSDKELTKLFNEEHAQQLTRRTMQQYRHKLGILNSKQRKKGGRK